MAAGPYAVDGVDGRRAGHRRGGGVPRPAARGRRRPPGRRAALRRRRRRRPGRGRAGRRRHPQPARHARRGPPRTRRPTTADAAPSRPSPPADRPATAPATPGGRRPAPVRAILADALDVEPRTDLAWAGRRDRCAPTPWRPCRPAGCDRVVLGTGGLTDGDDGGRALAAAAPPPTRTRDHRGRAARGPGRRPDARATSSARPSRRPAGARWPSSATSPSSPCSRLQAPAGTRADRAGRAAAGRRGRPRGRRRDDGRHRRPAVAAARRPGRAVRRARRRAGDLADPATPAGLDPAGLADVAAAVAVRDDLAGAVVGDADTALQAYDAAIARATSVAWRGGPRGLPRAPRARPARDHGPAARAR